MTDPNTNPYGTPAPQNPTPEQPQYQAPAQPQYQAPTPAPGMPAPAAATDYAANVQASVTNFAQQMGGKSVNVGGQNFDYISIITFVAAVVSLLGCIVPFASISAFGYSQEASLFTGGDGWFFLAIAVVVVILTVFKKHLAAMIIAIIDLALGIFEIVWTNHKIDELVSGYGSLGSLAKNAIHYSIGAWLVIIAGIAMVVGTLLAFINQRKAKAGATPSGAAAPQAPYGAAPTPFPGAPAPAVPAAPGAAPAAPYAAAPTVPSVPLPQAPAAPAATDQTVPAAPAASAPSDPYNGQFPTATPQA
ncbi:ABC transporter permease [Bifidobacterium leontopitheci]|uniref:Sodium pump decarboxylase, gamma subunit n=1 Tax=Bifidobacterium leontopitheci TaxID=2650774 RepID=A0A6I1GHH1_9BIFI|nr:ABC transporter permease [Bifidobacterium leontopitheci]KAB7791100.1 sodium pump decarboxylase, gamma subunit [Bifidobacterium leontopitheci]